MLYEQVALCTSSPRPAPVERTSGRPASISLEINEAPAACTRRAAQTKRTGLEINALVSEMLQEQVVLCTSSPQPDPPHAAQPESRKERSPRCLRSPRSPNEAHRSRAHRSRPRNALGATCPQHIVAAARPQAEPNQPKSRKYRSSSCLPTTSGAVDALRSRAQRPWFRNAQRASCPLHFFAAASRGRASVGPASQSLESDEAPVSCTRRAAQTKRTGPKPNDLISELLHEQVALCTSSPQQRPSRARVEAADPSKSRK